MMGKKFSNSYLAYFLMYNFYFLSNSLFSTLISVYMLDKGYTAGQVSIVVSASFFSSMLAQPIMGLLTDTLGIKRVSLISFFLIILGDIFFMEADNLWLLAIWYSFVLMLINGVGTVMDVLATQSPYKYGKIRIWGTIGYAVGSQLAGLIYKNISPQAIYLVFIGTMLLSILGVLGMNPKRDKLTKKSEKRGHSLFSAILKNRTYLFYLFLVALYSGVGNTGHTYIPSMLEFSGLSVDWATTVVAVSVLCEAPLIFYSYLFMDKIAVKKLLYICLGMMLLQYAVYALNFGLGSKIVVTLLSKHASGMVLTMLSLRIVANLVDEKYLVTAFALLQTGRNLGTIFIQNMSGSILDRFGYGSMNFMLAAIIGLVLLLALFLKVPEKKNQNLFG